MKKYTVLPLALAVVIFSAACSAQSTSQTSIGSVSASSEENTTQTSDVTADMFTDRDLEIGYDEESAVKITLSSNSASSTSDAVNISGSTVTITDEGTYILSGTLDDGMIIVNAEDTDKVQLVLNGANITSSSSAAIYVLQADKVFITTAENSDNTLTNGGQYVAIDDNNIDSVIFAKSDLTLNGAGTLNINASSGHGIVSKDDLVLASGIYNITSASHGISGKDSVRIAGGTFNIVSGKDGIHSENADDTTLGFVYIADGNFNITSEGDGISAEAYLIADNGTYEIQSGGGSANAAEKVQNNNRDFGGKAPRGNAPETVTPGENPPEMVPPEGSAPERGGQRANLPEEKEASDSQTQNTNVQETADTTEQSTDTTDSATSTKGIKAGSDLTINGGTYNIDSADDALHSNANLTINGGSFEISTGDDGVHADSATTITDGSINISQSYEGIEGLSIDITGGNISLVASDDGINAAGGNDSSGFGGRGGDGFAATEGAYINISGGTVYINASGDGIDSNGSLTVTGGETYVSGPTSGGDSALDYNGDAAINGGIFIATGSSGMAQNFGSSSEQGVIMVTTGSGSTGSTITLTDSSGNELLSWQADKEFTSVIVSCPEITEGSTYTLTVDDNTTEITMDSLVYGSASMGGGRGGKGEVKEARGQTQ